MTTATLTGPAVVFEAAADLIERNGLYKHGYWPGWALGEGQYTPGDPCCPLGAIAVVSGYRKQAACVHPASAALRSYINRDRASRTGLASWSDELGRTAEDVVEAIRSAARAWRADRDPV